MEPSPSNCPVNAYTYPVIEYTLPMRPQPSTNAVALAFASLMPDALEARFTSPLPSSPHRIVELRMGLRDGNIATEPREETLSAVRLMPEARFTRLPSSP